MRHFSRFAVLFCMAMAIMVAPSARAEDVLKAIPSDAYMVAYTKHLAQTNEKLADLSQAVGLPIPNLLEILKLSPEVTAVLDKQGMAAVAILPRENSPPGVVGFLAVSDYAALVKQLAAEDTEDGISKVTIAGQPMLVANKGDYAVVAAGGERALLAGVLQNKKAFSRQARPLREMLKDGDLNFIVSRNGIELAMQQALASFAQIKAQLAQGGEQAKQAVAALKIYESLFNAIEENVTHFALSTRVDEQGAVHVATRTLVKSSGGFAEFAKVAAAPPEASLKNLPQEPIVFAFSGTTSGSWAEGMMRWSMDVWRNMFGNGEISDEQIDEVVKASALAMKDVHSMSMALGVGEADEPLYGAMYFALETENAEQYLDRYVELLDKLKSLGDEKPLPLYGDMETETIKVDGVRTLKITMDVAAIAGGPQQAQMAEMYKKMFGGEKMVIYLAGANETTVVGAYTSEDALRKSLKVVKESQADLAGDQRIAQTTAMLPSEAHWRAYLSVDGMIEFAERSIAMLAPVAIPEFPEIPSSPPIGFSAQILPNGIDTNMIVAAETIKAIGTFAKRVSQMQANPNPNQN